MLGFELTTSLLWVSYHNPYNGGQFHIIVPNHNLQILNSVYTLTTIFHRNWENSVNYVQMAAIMYKEKSFMEYVTGLLVLKHSMLVQMGGSVTRLVNFWKSLTTFFTKVTQIFRFLFSYFVIRHFWCKTCSGSFLDKYWEKFGYFLFQNLVSLFGR